MSPDRGHQASTYILLCTCIHISETTYIQKKCTFTTHTNENEGRLEAEKRGDPLLEVSLPVPVPLATLAPSTSPTTTAGEASIPLCHPRSAFQRYKLQKQHGFLLRGENCISEPPSKPLRWYQQPRRWMPPPWKSLPQGFRTFPMIVYIPRAPLTGSSCSVALV